MSSPRRNVIGDIKLFSCDLCKHPRKLTSHSIKSLVPCLEQNRLNYLKSQPVKLGREDRVPS
jgi:hypothetical protein